MTLASILFSICLLAGIGALQLTGRPAAAADDQRVQAIHRSIWSITLATPALLVPALLCGVITWGVLANGHDLWRWTGGAVFLGRPTGRGVTLLVTSAVLVAGYVGLLTGWYRGARVDGAHFWQGIKDHSITFVLALLAIHFAILVLTRITPHATPLAAFVCVAPSLLLAPLVGTAALHPRRPIRAIKAAIDRTWDLPATSRLILLQIGVLLGLWIVQRGLGDHTFSTGPGLRHVQELAASATALSFNPLPFFTAAWSGQGEFWTGVLCTASSLFFSAVFMHLHFRRVLVRPRR